MDETEINREFVEIRMDKEVVATGIQAYLAMDEDAMQKKFDERCPAAGIKPTSKVISFAWPRAAAVILFILVIGGSSYLLYHQAKRSVHPAVEVAKRASLVVSDGDTVYLDEVQKDGGLEVDGWKIILTGSQQIAYLPAGNLAGKDNKICFHTINNPYGQKWKVTLPDQSSMQLNAGSSLTFPVKAQPTGNNDRKMKLSGEAYFQVTPNPHSPLIVSTEKGEFEAIGTAFDVRDYQQERKRMVWVTEGAISARQGNQECKVEKGYMAEIGASIDDRWQLTYCDSPALSWRSDFFNLGHLNLRESMQELGNWYGRKVEILPGVDTVTRGILSGGRIKKVAKLEQLLPHLGIGYKVHLTTDGEKIIASP
jgi:ferric-dicitrate binding protein FerR (iron transport regulator)